MTIQEQNQFNQSFVTKSLKTQYLQRIYIAKFQMNDCFKKFTHSPIVFAHCVARST